MANVRLAFNFRAWKPMKNEIAHALSVIQKDEKERIMQYVFQKDAKASLAGRLLMRYVVSKYYQIPWAKIYLKRNAKGKPFLSPGDFDQAKFDFNISHQGMFSVLASSPCNNIGIDIMKIEDPSVKNVPEFFRLMYRQFSPSEWLYIKKYETERLQLKAFYRMWCLKEAFVKASGVGITVNLQSISFTIFDELTREKTVTSSIVHVNGNLDTLIKFEENMLDEDHIVTVAHTILSNEIVPKFEFITFEEMIEHSQPICDIDTESASAFVAKEETPWSM